MDKEPNKVPMDNDDDYQKIRIQSVPLMTKQPLEDNILLTVLIIMEIIAQKIVNGRQC